MASAGFSRAGFVPGLVPAFGTLIGKINLVADVQP